MEEVESLNSVERLSSRKTFRLEVKILRICWTLISKPCWKNADSEVLSGLRLWDFEGIDEARIGLIEAATDILHLAMGPNQYMTYQALTVNRYYTIIELEITQATDTWIRSNGTSLFWELWTNGTSSIKFPSMAQSPIQNLQKSATSPKIAFVES